MAARRGRGWRDPAKERRWRGLIDQWRGSGLSVREFCDWQELSEPTFYFWRREVAQRDREAAGALVVENRESRTSVPNGLAAAGTAVFLPVHVVPETPAVATANPPRTDGIEVHLPSGVRLHVPARYDRQALVDVLAALEARPC